MKTHLPALPRACSAIFGYGLLQALVLYSGNLSSNITQHIPKRVPENATPIPKAAINTSPPQPEDGK